MQVAGSALRTKSFGAFEVDLKSAELRKRGIRIKLQDQPFQILTFLMEHPGDLVTREELRQRLWAEHTFVDFDRSLNKAMTKLRSALGDSADSPRYIETIPRHGYRFLAEVHASDHPRGIAERSHGDDLQAVVSTLPGQSPANLPEPHRGGFLARLAPVRSFYAIPLILLAALLLGGGYLLMQERVARGVAASPAPARRSVAVVGFKNLSSDPQSAWLSTALSDWIMTELSAGEQLRTIPAESVVRMRMELSLPDVDSLGKDTLDRIRKNLGTDYVVVGSYVELGAGAEEQIRLDLRLQDTRSGETVGAFSETGTEAHLSDLISRAGERLRQNLGVRAVTKEEAAEAATAVPVKAETAKLYSEGLQKLRDFDALAARTLLTKAIALEPDYAPSHAALATTLLQLGYDRQAVAEAKKAFDLSGNLSRAERLLIEGRYREVSRDWEHAIEIYRALFEFFPDNLEYGLNLVRAEVAANKWKDALETIGALRSLPAPLRDDPRIDLSENDASRSLGDTRRAEAALERAAEKARAAGTSLLLAKARREQAWLFENSGREEEVEGAVNEAMQLYVAAHDHLGVAAVATLQAIALERQGDYQGARSKYQESLGIYEQSGNKISLGAEYDNIGDILLFLGDAPGAQKSYQAALATYQEIGDQNGVALARIGLGDVLLLMGRLGEARAMYVEAFDICSQLGSRNRQALALAGLARVQQFEGQSAEAQKKESEAVAILEEVGNKTEAERVRMALAEVMLDDGKAVQAEALARRSVVVLEEKKALRSAALAKLVLARALSQNGRTDEAREILAQVTASSARSQDHELQLRAEILSAQIAGVSGGPADVSLSIQRLARIAASATAASYLDVAFQARLIEGQLQMIKGDQRAGRVALLGLQSDSNKAGFAATARRAAESMQAGAIRSGN